MGFLDFLEDAVKGTVVGVAAAADCRYSAGG